MKKPVKKVVTNLKISKDAKTALSQAVSVIEHFQTLLPMMTIEDKIDAAARFKSALKILNAFDEAVKTEVKGKLNNTEGQFAGHDYVAMLSYNPIKRLNVSRLKTEDLPTWEKYAETNPEGRVTFIRKN